MAASGIALTAIGAVVPATLAIPVWTKLTAAAALLVVGSVGLFRWFRRQHRIEAYRVFEDGSVEIVYIGGRRRSARLAAGTMTLPRVAWLRLGLRSGATISELVAGDPRESQQWRRFQVICRHVAAC